MFLAFGLCSGLAAFGLLGGAIWAYLKQQRTMRGRVAGRGVVIELTEKSTASARGYILCPVIKFSPPGGETVTFTSEYGSFPAGNKIGETVNIRYDPANPQEAEVDSAMSTWLVPLILVFMGVIACCLAVAFTAFYWLGFSPS